MLSQNLVHSLSDVLFYFIYFFVFPEGRESWCIWHLCKRKWNNGEKEKKKKRGKITPVAAFMNKNKPLISDLYKEIIFHMSQGAEENVWSEGEGEIVALAQPC